ncbi:MAG: energy transducer TonB, partial [Bacteroides sp.]|nr:energy transducer TonB [Bacteroides sp.]
SDGSISNIRVTKSVDPYLDKEAVRVVKSMPRWIPGTQDGKPVNVEYTLPITFKL